MSGRGIGRALRAHSDLVHVAKGTVIAFAVRSLAAVATFAFNVVLAHRLGAGPTGSFVLATSVVLVVTVIARWGMDMTVVRFVAIHAAQRQWSRVASVYRWGVGFPLLLSIVAALVTALGAGALNDWFFHKPLFTPILRVIAWSIIPGAFVALNGEAVKALGRIFWSQLTQSLLAPLVTVGCLLAISRATPLRVAWLYNLGLIVAALLGAIVWRVFMRPRRPRYWPYDPMPLFRASWPLLFVSSMVYVMAWAAVLLLGVWWPAAEVAVFGMASRTALATSVLLRSVSGVVAPRFASLYAAGDLDALGKTARQSTGLITVAAAPVFIGMLIAPSAIMKLFGPEFAAGGMTLAVLSLGQFVNIATGTVGDILAMSGHERLLRRTLAVGTGANLALCFALIPRYGAVGAAIATSTSVIGLNLYQAYYVYKRLHIITIPLLGLLPLRRSTDPSAHA